ncbi:MAG: hypothetical protein HXY18_09315 [Bryobacteraceae bacterium]|nr:hypothetical protein [Bryobacteraceae bacterium]
MNKPLVGVIAGAILGALDGATAWFTPAVRDQMSGIMAGSSMKGLVVGLAAGFFARKVQSDGKGIVFGAVIGLILAGIVAAMPDPNTGQHYWVQIMLPGFVFGALTGYLTQRYGSRPANAG